MFSKFLLAYRLTGKNELISAPRRACGKFASILESFAFSVAARRDRVKFGDVAKINVRKIYLAPSLAWCHNLWIIRNLRRSSSLCQIVRRGR